MNLNNYFLPVIFGLSGITALIYEIIWSRLFQYVLGSTIHTSSMVFSAFLAGFALGSIITGLKLKKNNSTFKTIGICEIFLGVYALFLSLMFKHNYLNFLISYPLFTRLLLCLLILLPPAFLLGALWPLVSQIYIKNIKNISSNTGLIYSFNSFGSGIGAFISGFVLIPWLGLNITSYVAMTINLIIGMVILFIPRNNWIAKK